MELTCHPATPAGAVDAVSAEVSRAPDARLRFRFIVRGDIARVRVPPFREPRAGSELWRHTCCEAFVAVDGVAAYHELNVSPSGEWAVMAFTGYRDLAPLAAVVPTPSIAVRATARRLELEMAVAFGCLSARHATARLRLALAAIVEETSGAVSYWALHHAAGRPDFHHRDAFVARLEPPGGAC
jgi:hypothetical protein